MVIEAEESLRSTSYSIVLSEEQMRRVEVPCDGSCWYWAVALPYLIQVNNNIDLFNARFERLFGEKELSHSHHIRRVISEFHTSHRNNNDINIYDDQTLRALVTRVFRHRFYESISIGDFKDLKNDLFITDGTFRANFEAHFSFLIELGSDIDLDNLNPEVLDEKTIVGIEMELDKVVKLGWGDLLQRFKYRMYLEAMKSRSSWEGNSGDEMMKRMLGCEILVDFEKRLVSVPENSIICLFIHQRVHYQFFLIKAQFLIEFIDRNFEDICLEYLKMGVDDINYQNSNGSTLLHFAAKNNHVRSIHLLVNQGAELNIKNHLEQTPLHIATSFNSHAAITALNTHINRDLSDIDNATPNNIISLVSNKMDKLYLVAELEFDCIGRTELHTAAEEGNVQSLMSILSSLEKDKQLLRFVLDAPIRGERKLTALHLAAKNNRVEAVDILLEYKAEVNIRDENIEGFPDLTPSHYAAEKGHLNIVKLLIEKGKAQIDILDCTEASLLQRAVTFGQLLVVKYLVGIGACVNSRDQNSTSVLSHAAKAGCLNTAHFLVEKGAEINSLDKNNVTPLHHAAVNNKWEIVRYLVERGADPNVKCKGNNTALNKVIEAGQWRLAKLLIENGALTEGLTETQMSEVLERNSIGLEGEDAIYNLIGLGNSQLLEKYIDQLVINNPHFFNDDLPKIYEEMKLLNIPLSRSVSLFIEDEIIKSRLFSSGKVTETCLKNIDKRHNNNNLAENVRWRINSIVEAIAIAEEMNVILSRNEVHEMFLFLLKLIAQNIQLLKNQSMHFARDKIPWIEMQFCIVNFISRVSVEAKHSDVVYTLVLNRTRLVKHLRLFKTELEKLDVEVALGSKHRFQYRKDTVERIVESNSGFRDLYEDYELLRDVYSLNRIESYLNPACSVDLSKGDVLVGEQVILRALQVTGECLKNTIESPNMSDKVHHLLIALAPVNVIKLVTSLRDSLSHVEHLHKRKDAEDQSSLIDIQKDLIKLKEEITFISLLKRNLALERFFKSVYECENIARAKEIIDGVYYNSGGICIRQTSSHNEVFNAVVELLQKFESQIQTTHSYNNNQQQQSYFKKLKDIIRKHRLRVADVNRKHVSNFKAVNYALNLIESDAAEIEEVRRCAQNEITRLNLQLQINEENVCEDILQICFEIYFSLDVKERSREIDSSYSKIYQMTEFEAKRVRTIDRFKTKMSSKEMNNNYYFADEMEKTKEVEERVNNILRNVCREISDVEEVKNQLLNEMEMKRQVFRSKNTLINYYSKIQELHVKVVKFYDRFRDTYLNVMKFCNVYSLKLTNGSLNEDGIDELLSEFNLKEIIRDVGAFKIIMEKKIQISDLGEILREFNFDKLLLIDDYDEKLIDKNLCEKLFYAFGKIKCKKIIKDEDKVASLVNEIQLKTSIEEIKRDLKLDESTFSALIDNVRMKLNKKGETRESLFSDFSLSRCKTILNTLRKMDVDSFGKLVKDVTKEAEIVKLIKPFHEFINSLNVHLNVEIDILIDNTFERIKNEQILRLRKYFFEKLDILTKVLPSEKSDLELLNLLKTDDNIRIAVEMLVLNLTETLNQLSLFEPNRLYLDELSPVLVGKNLRNYLAHGDPLINILPTNYHISLIAHFRLFQREFHKYGAFYSGQYLIGKVTKENLVQVEHNFQQKVEVLNINQNLLRRSEHSGIDEFMKLIGNSFYLKAQSPFGNTLLHFFARADNLSVFQYLLIEQNLSLFLKNVYGHSALHLAATTGSVRIIEFLLVKGLEASFIVANGDTLLHLAVQSGHLNIVKLLLKNGADIEAANNRGIKPIVKAAFGGHKNIVTELINAGCDLDSRDEDGRTLLHLATSNVELLQILLVTRKVDINAFDHDLKTPLHSACEKGDEAIVRVLLDNEANVNCKTKTGETPLHLAAGRGHIKAVRVLLLTKNVEIDSVMVFGRYTALHLACFPGHFDVVELLLKNGADFNAKNVDDTNALHIASWRGHVPLLEILFDYPVEMDDLSHGKTALHIAVESGFTRVFRKLYEKGANIFLKNAHGMSVLHLASHAGSVEMMELIFDVEKRLGRSELVNAMDDRGRTALHLAVAANNVECVAFLIENKADVEAKDFKKKTPLHVAATMGHADVFDLLESKGSNVKAKDNLGWSALHLAAQSNNIAIVTKLMRRKKVNVNARSDDGSRTALLIASHNGSLEIVKLLLRNGADILFANGSGGSAVHYAALYGHVEIVDFLLETIAKNHFLNINVTAPFGLPEKDDANFQLRVDNYKDAKALDRFKATVLEVAAENGSASCVKLLIERGTDVNLSTTLGRTALHHSAHKGELEIIKILLSHAACNVNARDDEGRWTPLHLAATGGHLEAVKFLLTNEADINLKAVNGFTALHVAADFGFLNIVEEILRGDDEAEVDVTNDKNETPLHRAARNGHCEVARFLLDKKADVNAVDAVRNTPLQAATFAGDVQTVRLLLNSGAIVDFPCQGEFTPLHGAAYHGQLEMAVELIKFGADVNRKSGQNSSTPLHVAVERNKVSVVGHLLSLENVEVNAKDLVGHTPLHVAAIFGFVEIADMLIKARAEVNGKSHQTYTPLHLAAKSANCQLLKLLADNGAEVNAIFGDGVTALELALGNRSTHAVEILVENGANVTDELIELAGRLGFFDGFIQLAERVRGGGGKGTALHKVIKCKSETILKMMVAGINAQTQWDFERLNSTMNAVDEDGKTPLICAAEEGCLAAVNLLLAFKVVKVNERTTRDGMTALHLSAQNGHEKIVQMLISKRADANLRDVSGRTAFDLVGEKLISDEAEKYQLIAGLLLSVTKLD